MKNKFLLLFLLIVFNVSCSGQKSNDIRQTDPIIVQTKLEIEEVLGSLKKEESIIDYLKKNNDGNYFEELPRIESYYTDEPFFEYYQLLSVKEKDIDLCEKIEESDNIKICKTLYELYYINNKSLFIKEYIKYGEDLDFSNNIFDVYGGINTKTCNQITEIMPYLMCKKVLEKKLDVRSIFIKYSILEGSNKSIVKDYYEIVSDYWKMDIGFKNVVKKSLIFNEKNNEIQ